MPVGDADALGCSILRYAEDWRQQAKARVPIPLRPRALG